MCGKLYHCLVVPLVLWRSFVFAGPTVLGAAGWRLRRLSFGNCWRCVAAVDSGCPPLLCCVEEAAPSRLVVEGGLGWLLRLCLARGCGIAWAWCVGLGVRGASLPLSWLALPPCVASPLQSPDLGPCGSAHLPAKGAWWIWSTGGGIGGAVPAAMAWISARPGFLGA